MTPVRRDLTPADSRNLESPSLRNGTYDDSVNAGTVPRVLEFDLVSQEFNDLTISR